MYRRKLTLLLLAALSLGLASFVVTLSYAANDDASLESITLSPSSRHYAKDAGSTSDDSLTIINDGKTAYDFIVYARPYSVMNAAYEPNFTAAPPKAPNADAYRWIQFNQTNYHLDAGQSVIVNYTLNIPADSAPGGHYGVIFAETQPSSASTGDAVVRKKRVGAIIYATVNGKTTLQGEVTGSQADWLQTRPPLRAATTVKNTGNTDFQDNVTYTVSDVFGNSKYQVSKSFVVLPQTSRDITLEWSNSPWFGIYKVNVTQKYLETSSVFDGYVLVTPRWLMLLVLLVAIGGTGYAAVRQYRYRKTR